MKNYNPKEVTLIIGGRIIKSWNTVRVAMDEDEWTFTAGTTGESTRTKNANKLGSLVITSPQASEDNAFMSAFQASGTLIPCSVVDKSGTSIHVMAKGTVVKMPDAEYGKEAGEREWTVKGDIETNLVGGNIE